MTPADRIATARAGQRLAAFIHELSSLMEGAPDEAALLCQGKEFLGALVSRDDWLEPAFARPSSEHFQQYLLHGDPQERFSIVSFVWGPGQFTPIHDHMTWGLVGLLRGEEVSEAFEIRGGRPVSIGEVRLAPGDVAVLSPTNGDIHQVRNGFDDRVSISIHVYGGDIGSIERHAYPLEGGVKTFISGYSSPAPPLGGTGDA